MPSNPNNKNIQTLQEILNRVLVQDGSGNWGLAFLNSDGSAISGGGGSGVTTSTKRIYIPASAMIPAYTAGCSNLINTETTAARPDISGLYFDDTTAEHAKFFLTMPNLWDKGVINFRVNWTTVGHANAGNVGWDLKAVAVSDNDTIDVVYGTAVEVIDASLTTAEDLHVSALSGDLTVAGSPANEDTIFFDLYRNTSVGSNMTGDATLLGVSIIFGAAASLDEA